MRLQVQLDAEIETLAEAYLRYVTPPHFDPPEGRRVGLLADAAAVGLCSADALVVEPLRVELARTDLERVGAVETVRIGSDARARAERLAGLLGVDSARMGELYAAAVRVGLRRLQPRTEVSAQ